MSNKQLENSVGSAEVKNNAGKTSDLDRNLFNQAFDIMLNAGNEAASILNSAKGKTSETTNDSSLSSAIARGAIAGSIIGNALASGAASSAGKAAAEGAAAAGKGAYDGAVAGAILGKTISESIANGIGDGIVRRSGINDLPSMPQENSSKLPPVIIKDGAIIIGRDPSDKIGPRSMKWPGEGQVPRRKSPEELDPGFRFKRENEKEGSGKRDLQNKGPRSISDILRDAMIYPQKLEP